MAKAIDLLVDQEFQSEYDSDDVKTTFMLKSLSGMEYLECTSKGFVDYEKIIKIGLTGWKNFPDNEGVEIPFDVENMSRIPPMILQDISFQILNISSNSEDERKNF
jgi:hypothetical protein